MKNEKEVRLGIIGLGSMGAVHATSIMENKIPGMVLSGVSDANQSKAEQFPDIPYFKDVEGLIGSGQVDALLIATPHYLHTSIGIAALEAGLHVLVEKPISVHKADCERLIAAHRDPEQVFAAMFNQRTDPRYVKLKELISGGELGRINRVNWIITDWYRTETYYASGAWRATWSGEGGGVLMNQCPHQLDLWQWLFGMPEKVRGFCDNGRFHTIEVEDDVTAYMEYGNGMKGVFITTTGEAPGTNRLEIAAERGRIIVEGDTIDWIRNEVDSSVFSRETKSSFDKPETTHEAMAFEGNGEQHLGILKNFAKAILEGETLIAPGAEGIRSVELANAIIHSSDLGQTLTLPLDGAAYEAGLKRKIESSSFVKPEVVDAPSPDDFSKSFQK